MTNADTLRALVFDLDGTLVDSDPFHFQAYHEIAARHGVAIDESFFAAHVSGHTNAEACAAMFPAMTHDEHRAIAAEKEVNFRAALATAQALPGVHALFDWAVAENLRIGLVTNAPAANVDHMLGVLGLTGRFDTIVLGETLARGKPDPLPYVTALQRLGIDAGAAVAFEDAVPGVISAVTAGIATVGITASRGDALAAAGAALIVPDFTDARLTRFLGVCGGG
ncbi:MAG: haloacid dehalogenase superfamily protein subfamily variant 3 with third motif having or [Rhodospirillales bacterium]|nr:haloacid dehalogenase superfamily protein subfamily variant 3 with third motif having or [Rhodospirillales bacterium]